MKKRLCLVLLLTIIFGASFLNTQNASAGVNDFEFSSFEADYYLYKDSEGVSRLHVVENLTAVFPEDYDQNKGICRRIPFTNQKGKNRTLKDLNESNISVLRNGNSEPIYSIEKVDDEYEVCTGTEEYLYGTQSYTFEYEFERVVTEYTDDVKTWQELYWDTNGTGWRQSFDKLVARVHFADESALSGDSWCYVGEYGDSDQTRCFKTEISDGIMFEAYGLEAHENVTFDIELKADSFVIPEPEKTYICYILFGVIVLICALIIFLKIRKFRCTSEKRAYYKGLFVKPEYQPDPNYHFSELCATSMKKLKEPQVAILLKMVVNKKIELIKGERKVFGGYNWTIKVLANPEYINNEEEILLRILKGGETIKQGDMIEVKKRYPDSRLVSLGMRFDILGPNTAAQKHLIESGSKTLANNQKSKTGLFITFAIVGFAPLIGTLLAATEALSDVYYGMTLEGMIPMFFSAILVIYITIITSIILGAMSRPYLNIEKRGLEVSRYLEGLKLYISMAEKDRLEFLQSVENAETSKEGIVKIYEDLLPYAALFGVEKSWMNELSAYCEVNKIDTPEYCSVGMMYDFHTAIHSISTASISSSHESSSGSSSGFSGGGGGGFSGGGGGGGGGGGR